MYKKKDNDIVGIGKVLLLLCALFVVLGFFSWYVYPGRDRISSLFWGFYNQTNYSTTVLMTVRYEGGLCSNNKICRSEHHLYQNGSFDDHRQLSSSEIEELKNAIDTTRLDEYGKISQPDCPSYVDGADEVLLFPQKYPDQSFKLCELDIPAEDVSVKKINEIITSHSR